MGETRAGRPGPSGPGDGSAGPLDDIPTLELLARLAGGVAHDLNNLLTVITGRAMLALDRLPLDQPVRRDLEVIQEMAERAVAVVEQLRAFGRRQRLTARPVDVNLEVQGMAEALRSALGDRIELVLQPAPEPGRAELDTEQFGQVLLHLAAVARDAMPDGGRFTIAIAVGEGAGRPGPAGRAPAHVLVRVSDTGPPLDPDARRRIFEPFIPVAGRRRGPGLRLAAAAGIVEQSGGHIELESGPAGTTFCIHLPVAESPPPAPAEPVAPPVPRPATVVVVDDEEHVRDFSSQVLRRAGYDVLEADNGAQALWLIQHGERPVRLVVTDMVMPEMSGQELARRLAATHPGIKVLFVSAFASDVHTPRARPGAEAEFLPKPFTAEALVRRVRRLIG